MVNGHSPRARRALAVIVVAAVAAGCGSSGPSGPTRAQVIKRVDAICAKRNAVITAGASKLLAGGKLPTPAKFAKFAFGTIVPQTSMQIAQVSAIKPPASMAGAYNTWVADMKAALAKIKANPIVIQHSSNFNTVNAQAKSLGLSSNCDIGPSS
jgi:hypothetical protein